MKYATSFILLVLLFACSSKLSEEEYYTKAKEFYSNQKFEEAVSNFKSLIEYYPKSKYAAESMFLVGFIYANDIKNYDEAKVYYEKFIATYPDNDLVDDAQYELKNLGKDINDLSIFQNAAADSADTKTKK